MSNTTNGVFTLRNAIGNLSAGTVLKLTLSGNELYVPQASSLRFSLTDCNVVFTPTREVVSIPVDYDALDKVTEAAAEAIERGDFAYGEKYLFFQMADKTWRKATMERTSSDFGRLVSGFCLTVDASAKQKFNRLTNLNKAYGLGLTVEEIRTARDGVNS